MIHPSPEQNSLPKGGLHRTEFDQLTREGLVHQQQPEFLAAAGARDSEDLVSPQRNNKQGLRRAGSRVDSPKRLEPSSFYVSCGQYFWGMFWNGIFWNELDNVTN